VTRRPTLLLTTLSAAALVLTACGSDPEPEASAEPTATCESVPATAEAPSSVSTDLAVAPEVPASDGLPPCGLVVSDVVVGDGAVAEQGDPVEVKYVGAFYDTGEQFDSSWSRGDTETLPFTAGGGQVIEGFDEGTLGMAVGGRRYVTIPSDLGYGPAGQGPIPGGATLVFVVDLVSVG